MTSAHFRYQDQPGPLKAKIDALLANAPGSPDPAGGAADDPAPTPIAPPRASQALRKPKFPNKTEASYRREILDPRSDLAAVRYEAISLRMANGHRYTPDWLVVTAAGEVECHEVKGGYRLHSYQRARLAFDQVRIEFPWLTWVWAVKTSDGWSIDPVQSVPSTGGQLT